MNKVPKQMQDLKRRLAMILRVQGVKKTELARRLGVFPTQVTRILDPDHYTSLDRLEQAFKAVGYRLTVEVTDAAR